MSSVLSCFLFYFHCSSSQFTQPSPLPSLPCSGWPGPCDLAVRATPPRPPALRPPWVAWASAAWAAPGRAVPSGESPPRQRPPASSCVRAVGAAKACRRRRVVRDARTGCRAPPAAAFRAFLSFGDLHKGCDSASEHGAELQRPASLAATIPVFRRSGQACSS